MQTAKPCNNIGGAVPCLVCLKVVCDFISRPWPIAAIICRQTRPSAPVIFILDDSAGLFAKHIEIIPGTTPQMLHFSPENSA
jgi:hypothetical protein